MTKRNEGLGQVLHAISEEVPSLLKALTRMASLQIGREMEEAATSFYGELREAGMPDRTALELTEDYVSIFTDRPEEVMEQVIATRMFHKAETEPVEEEKRSEKGLSGLFSNVKEKVRKAFRF